MPSDEDDYLNYVVNRTGIAMFFLLVTACLFYPIGSNRDVNKDVVQAHKIKGDIGFMEISEEGRKIVVTLKNGHVYEITSHKHPMKLKKKS